MPDLADGETFEMQGSGAKPYILKNVGGVYSCTCPAWRNQSLAIERRTCKHLRKLRGDEAEEARVGGALPQKPARPAGEGEEEEKAGPPLLLAHSWDNAADLTGWWMSEKLDGVRAYWDGRQFISRQGNLYHAPDWFIEGLPQTPLDGELWIDRRKFQRTVSIVRRQDKTDLWKEVSYVVFDAPAAGGGFEDRLGFLKDALQGKKMQFARLHEHDRCKGIESLRAELARIEGLGGEGLMLRRPGSKYEIGRSMTLLKVKTFKDAEAVVTGHLAGAGRHAGRLGALQVRLASGIEFSVGTGFSDKERAAPPPVGATITFRYQELSDGGVPRFPSYVGIRAEAAMPAVGGAVGAGGGVEMKQSKKRATISVPAAAETPAAAASPKEKKTMAKKSSSGAGGEKTGAPAGGEKTGVPAGGAKASGGGAGGAKASAPRYFEFIEGTSSKFWEVSSAGCEVTTHWGRIGSAGQSKTKAFDDEAAAKRQMEKLIEEKTKEGYQEKPRP